MTKPSNPTIVIGLGGTGQWVLTFVKKNMIDTYGDVPETVKLLAFDTTSEKTEAKEEHAKVGNIQLKDKDEFVYLDGNIKTIANEIKREGKHKQISPWFQADYYTTALDDDSFELSKGAGQRRPFGRMAVFYDLLKNPSQIVGKIAQAINDVKTRNLKNQPIEIYVVCSLAGGTGSGMVIDVAHIARKLAEDAQVAFAVRGFLVLQNTFNTVIDLRNILANSFAAVRELDRFMLVFDRDYPIFYADDTARPENLSVYRSIYRSKLFDNCYLLDAKRKNLPLDSVRPWEGIFPAVAECITLLMDPETGDTFSQHYKNVNERLAKQQLQLGQALYSSLGTYTYILPVEDMIETAIYRAGVELLQDHLFKIVRDPATEALRISSENQRELRDSPRDATATFFKSDKTPGGSPNLAFLQQMALTLENGRADDRQYIAAMASRGVELISWLSPVEKDDAVNTISNTIENIISASLTGEALTSEIEKDDFHSGADRIIRTIQQFREKKLGVEETNQRRIPGELQKGLGTYALRNRRRFRRSISELLSIVLNGENSDPLVAKSGKVAYMLEIFQWMAKSFDEFDGFLRAVWNYRAESGELAQARDDVARTRQAMMDTRDLTGIFDKLKKTAVHAQQDYIAAEDYLFSLEREDVLFRAMSDYVAMFRDIVQDARTNLQQWVQVLALGGSDSRVEPGVYPLMVEEQGRVKRRRTEQQSVKVYTYLTDESYENGLYMQMINDKWKEILKRITWEIAPIHNEGQDEGFMEEGQIRYAYNWEKDCPSDFMIKLNYDGQPLSIAATRQVPASRQNFDLLIKKLRPYFVDIRNETAAGRLASYKRAEGMAKEMLDMTGPLVQYDPPKQPAIESHNYVCVNHGVEVDYFESLANELRSNAPRAMDNKIIGLTNKHRCVVLSTSDLLVGQETVAITASQKAYRDYPGDHRLLHNFPAEVNASAFEDRIPRPPINEARRLMAPKLVALMDDREQLRRYILARVFGLIRQVATERGKNQYLLTLDRENSRDTVSSIALTMPSDDPQELDAMMQFAFVHIDQITGARHIRDITPELNVQIDPQRVDEMLDTRRSSILAGHRPVVEDFQKLLDTNRALLNNFKPESRDVLMNAFRRFLLSDYGDCERAQKLGNQSALDEYLLRFLKNNRDCIARDEDRDKEEIYQKSLAAEMRKMLEETMPKVKAMDVAVLVRELENYRDYHVLPLRDRNNDMITRDLGVVMHLVLADEINRLEKTTR